ncbi:MAG: hypothetical protein M3Q74_06075 [Pseudomonadota bacterium]|nr:hypothetical protein [Pseudomonadota bacterium]
MDTELAALATARDVERYIEQLPAGLVGRAWRPWNAWIAGDPVSIGE